MIASIMHPLLCHKKAAARLAAIDEALGKGNDRARGPGSRMAFVSVTAGIYGDDLHRFSRCTGLIGIFRFPSRR
jgi:hypothetical protein